MVDKEQHSNDISTHLDICFVEPLQTPIAGNEDDVNNVNDDNIGEEMNKQIPLENLYLAKVRLNYNYLVFWSNNV